MKKVFLNFFNGVDIELEKRELVNAGSNTWIERREWIDREELRRKIK